MPNLLSPLEGLLLLSTHSNSRIAGSGPRGLPGPELVLPGPFPEVPYCSLPALFMWVILENVSSGVPDLELYHKGKDGPGEAVICVISQEIPDPGKR